MRKNHRSGFTLVETLVSILILVIMVAATTTGMNAAVRIYKEATFHANSATLESMLRATLEDLLSYAQDVQTRPAAGNAEGNFLYTNYEYGVQDAYLRLNTTKTDGSPIQMVNQETGEARDLMNTGAYPMLTIRTPESGNWVVYGIPADAPAGSTEKVFTYNFTIVSQQDPNMTREVSGTIYLLNPEKTTEPTTT